MSRDLLQKLILFFFTRENRLDIPFCSSSIEIKAISYRIFVPKPCWMCLEEARLSHGAWRTGRPSSTPLTWSKEPQSNYKQFLTPALQDMHTVLSQEDRRRMSIPDKYQIGNTFLSSICNAAFWVPLHWRHYNTRISLFDSSSVRGFSFWL